MITKTNDTSIFSIHLECNEYNRSMLIFDIDSLIMLNVSDSEMSKSESISNIRLYQFIREKCKTANIEQVSDKNVSCTLIFSSAVYMHSKYLSLECYSCKRKMDGYRCETSTFTTTYC